MHIVLSTLNAKFIHTSLALRYLKAFSGDEFNMSIAEYTIKDPLMNVASDLYSRKPDVIGFSCYIWNIEETIRLIGMVKKIMPQVAIVLGGPEVSYDTEHWMRTIPEADFIVMGEGEETFRHLLQELQGDRKFHFVYGAAYRKNGEPILNPPRPKLKLDDIPSPHYFEEDRSQLPNRVVYFETSRGCPFSCQFCLSSIEVGVRYFDIERTKRDLLHLIRSGAKLIKFVDRTFNIKRDYALDIFDFLIRNHGDCVFQFEITADIMRPEVLDYLAEHAPPGVFRFEIGVQSTNDLTNEIIKRRQNFTKLSRTVNLIKQSGKITQHLDLIAGLPEEDYGSFRRTFNDVFALRPEELQLGFLKMLRGTGLRREADKYGYVYMDHAPYEILGNAIMPFGDIVRIKRVEDVLEKYWNAHRMDRTLEYLIEQEFTSAFDFFQQFGDFWEERGWQKIGHQLEDLFVRLRDFLLQRGTKRMDLIEGLMKADYLVNHKYKPRKIWWEFELGKERQSLLMKRLADKPEAVSPEFAALGLGEKELHKHVMLELLPAEAGLYLSGDAPSAAVAELATSGGVLDDEAEASFAASSGRAASAVAGATAAASGLSGTVSSASGPDRIGPAAGEDMAPKRYGNEHGVDKGLTVKARHQGAIGKSGSVREEANTALEGELLLLVYFRPDLPGDTSYYTVHMSRLAAE